MSTPPIEERGTARKSAYKDLFLTLPRFVGRRGGGRSSRGIPSPLGPPRKHGRLKQERNVENLKMKMS